VPGESLKFNKKFIIPLVLMVWLLLSLGFFVLIPPADANHTTSACPHNEAEAMTEVYSPERFRILNLCQSASGELTWFELWGDGDWNVYVRLDENSRSLVDGSGIKKLRTWEQARQNGGADMIWEAIPRDHENGGPLEACEPSVGDQTTVYGVHVVDKWHGWKEIHPITQVTKDGGTTCTRSEPTSTGSSGGGGECKETWGWGGRNRCE
jgi:hypothetical protein